MEVVGLCDDRGMTLIIAHRGASRELPENTIEAFRRAVEMGADGVELDVRRTADDHLVVHHDAELADGRIIRSTPRADLPDHVPDLTAALDACTGLFVNIEIKNSPDAPDFDPSDWVAARLAVELAATATSMVSISALVSSFRAETVAAFARYAPATRTALLTYGCGSGEIERVVASGHSAIHPDVELLDEAAVRDAHAAGLAVNTWTCNEPERLRELMAWGVDGICTDVPDVALAIRRRSFVS